MDSGETRDVQARMKPLHLPSLYIAGFRGIKEASVPRLGRVTLLTGKNSSGKTTVLEAVETFAARGRADVLSRLLSRRDELSIFTDEDGDKISGADPAALFYGRKVSSNSGIAIGPDVGAGERLSISGLPSISVVPPDEFPITSQMSPHDASDFLVLQATYGGGNRRLPWLIARENGGVDPYASRQYSRPVIRHDDLPAALKCHFLGPGPIATEPLSRWWDQIVLTPDEDRVVQALELVVGDAIRGVALVGRELLGSGSMRPRFVVKHRDDRDPVPLKSLGEGAVRLLGTSMSLATCKNGFLLIDEAENGLHHRVFYDYWRMVLRAAEENNVQVLATTHSFSCVRGFARAASESESDNVLVRIERERGETRVVSYSEDGLRVAAEQGIEVR